MPGWLSAVVAAARRRQSAPAETAAGHLPGLLRGELAWAARQAVHPVKLAAAALVAVAVAVALGPATPGPVIGLGWRLVLAVVLGIVAIAVAHLILLARSDRPQDALENLVVTVAAASLVVTATLLVAFGLAALDGTAPWEQLPELLVHLEIDTPLLVGAALMAVAVLVAGLSDRFAAPGFLVLLALGMVIGDDGLGWIRLADPVLVQSIAVVALVVILFEGGLAMGREEFKEGIAPGLSLATAGVAITAAVTALGSMAILDLDARIAWLIGAIVASTDAAAVFSVLRRPGFPPRIASVLRVESGVNDPIAVLLTLGIVAAWETPPPATSWLAFGAQQLIGGVAVGVAVGWLGTWLMRRAPLSPAGLYPVLALAFAGVAYGAAVTVGASGFLATYLAGVTMAASGMERLRVVRSFVGALTSGVEAGLFLLLGLLVFPSQLPRVAGTGLVVAGLLVLVARPLASWASLTWFGFERREIAAVSWLGLRGAVPIVLATLPFSAGVGDAPLIFDVVFFVVLVSALVQGTTAVPVIRRLGLRLEP